MSGFNIAEFNKILASELASYQVNPSVNELFDGKLTTPAEIQQFNNLTTLDFYTYMLHFLNIGMVDQFSRGEMRLGIDYFSDKIPSLNKI